jgi:RND family efflux transporter MFP subunit
MSVHAGNSLKSAATVIATVAVLWIFPLGCTRDSTSSPKTSPGKQEPHKVRVAAAEEGRLPRSVIVTGTLAADEEIVASFKVAGRVSEMAVDLGSPVRKGQVMARLDPTDFRIRVEQAEAALRQVRASLGLPSGGTDEAVDPEKTALVREARAVLEEARLNKDRMTMLRDKDLIARAEYDAAVSRLLVAEGRYQGALEEIRNRQEQLADRRSALSLARQQEADTVLRAPIDGAVREKRASVGEFLAAGAPVFGLVRINPLRLRVSVPERDAAAIKAGQAVKVRVESDPVEYGGRVVRISPAIQEMNRTLAVEAEVANRDGKLRPGSFAKAEIITEPSGTAVLVPASSVVAFAGIEKVIVVADNKSVEKRIRTGRKSGDRVEVLEGVAAGETVVVEPGNLAGGQPVVVTR